MLCQLSYTHHRLESFPSPPAPPQSSARPLGAPEGIRTPDPRLRRPLLFPPELLARIGASRFERPTPCSQGRCATRLRHAPSHLSNNIQPWRSQLDSRFPEMLDC